MVCLGNICRSPVAEAVLRQLAPAWTVDSAGTGDWHVGESPDPRAIAELARHGLATTHRGRQVQVADFRDFDLVLAMDGKNLHDLRRLRPADATARLALLGDFAVPAAAGGDVPDPYDDGPEAFSAVYLQVERCCRGLITAHPAG